MSQTPVTTVVAGLNRLAGETLRGITFIQGAAGESFYTYADFIGQARYCLHNLLESGVRAGDELVIQVEDNRQFLTIFWACLLGRIIPVPLAAGQQEEQQRKLAKVLEQLQRPWATGGPHVRTLAGARFLEPDELLLGRQMAEEQELPLPSDIAYIQYSSGSTGQPKGVVLTHANLCANVHAILERSGTTAQDIILSWMPLTHDMGMICFHLSGIIGGLQQYIMPVSLFIRRPLLWLELAAVKKVTQLYSPNFGLQFFLNAFSGKTTPPGWDLSAVRILYNGAEQISEKICRQFTTALQPYGLRGRVMFPGYGLAEASVAVALPDPGDPLRYHIVRRSSLQPGSALVWGEETEQEPHFAEVGYAVPDCGIRITHKGTVLPEAFLGDIEIKGKNVTAGYYRLPQKTAELFTEDGWLKTGDLGFMIDGRLVISGRSKNTIIINGLNYFQHDLESILLRIPGIEVGNLSVTSGWSERLQREELLVFLIFRESPEKFIPLRRQVRTQLQQALGIHADQVIPVKRIPKTTSGKIQHFRLVGAYREGEYDTLLSALQELEQMSSITQVLEKWLPVTAWDQHFYEAGLGSLQLLQLLADLEQHTGRKISVSALLQHDSPRKLLAYLEQETPAGIQTPALLPAALQAHYPVLPSQRKMWMMQQLPGKKTAFNISFLLQLQGPAETEKLRMVLQAVAQRHEALRTRFVWQNDSIRQRVLPAAEGHLPLDIRPVAEKDEQGIEQAANYIFDLENDALLRLVLWQGIEGGDLLQFTFHHIITDGWSVQLLMQEFDTLYSGRGELSPAPLQLKDYSAWYYDTGHAIARERAARYWADTFREGLTPLHLPYRQAGRKASGKAGYHYESFDTAFIAATDRVAAQYRVSRFTVLAALLYAALQRHGQQENIIAGIETANRELAAARNISGPLAGTLLVQARITGATSLEILLARLHAQLVNGMEAAAYAFDDLPALFMQEQIVHTQPLFNTMILYQQFADLFDTALSITGPRVEPVEIRDTLCDLLFEYFDEGKTLRLKICYDNGLFSRQEIRSFTAHLNILATHLLAHPQSTISQAPLLTAPEQLAAKTLAEGTPQSYPFQHINQLLQQAFDQYPEHTAIIYREESISYRQAAAITDRLAGCLQQQHGLRPGMTVVVHAGMSGQTVLLMLAIWKCGAVYVPADAGLPEERLQYIVSDCKAGLVIDSAKIEALFTAAANVISGIPSLQHELAAVIYTSGTTGYPKGVLLRHSGLADYVQTFSAYFRITAADTVIQQAAINFDTSLEEILPVLAKGGKLVIAPEGRHDINQLLAIMEQEQVTVLSTVPAIIQAINEIDPPLHHLRLLISGGDRLERLHIDRLNNRHFEIYNTYGPTEITICATYGKVLPGSGPVSIGKVIDNKSVYLLDQHLQPVPPGEAGELCIGGAGLAAGYLNQPALTEEKFVPHPLYPEQLLYRSGDRARHLEDGSLEFIGRTDSQVKISGYRIECEEIEQVMQRCCHHTCAVIPVKDAAGDDFLAAYVAGISAAGLQALQTDLGALLPFYMLPATYTILDTLPLNANGKVDRQRLPRVHRAAATEVAEETLTPLQQQLAEIWKEILDVAKVGPQSDFIQLGGHSLKVIRLIARVRKTMHVKLSLKDIFAYPRLEQQAACIAQLGRNAYQPLLPAPPQPHYPLSNGQQRVWIQDRLHPGNKAYNIMVAYQLHTELDPGRVENVYKLLVQRHESLRTIFKMEGTAVRQFIQDSTAAAYSFCYKDLRGQATPEQAADTYLEEESAFVFDLGRGPLARLHLLQAGDTAYRLIFHIHHIISDGWSVEVLLKELFTGLTTGEERVSPVLPVQYKDYACWQQEMLEGPAGEAMRRYWKEMFEDGIPVLSLPSDFVRPAQKTLQGAQLAFVVPPALHQALRKLQQHDQVSMFHVFMAAVYAFLYRASGQSAIVLGTLAAGRDHPDLESVTGFLVNTLPCLVNVPGNATFSELLQHIREQMLAGYEYREYPFDSLVEDLVPERDFSRSPLFDVLVTYDDRREDPRHFPGLGLSPVRLRGTVSKFDLTFHFEEGEQLRLFIDYATALYTADTVRRFYDQLERVLYTIYDQPNVRLQDISLLSETQARALERFNDTDWPHNNADRLHGLFTRQAQLHPDRPALVCEGRSVSYSALDLQSGQLAGLLQQQYGVRQGDFVLLLLQHGIPMMQAILAVLKAGAVYVPVDPAYPQERKQFIREDIQPVLIISDNREEEADGFPFLYLPDGLQAAVAYSCAPVAPQQDDAAYIIYTSGSTGRPKGVIVRHTSVVNLLQWLADYIQVPPAARFLSISNYAFDISVLEYFLLWCRGGTLLLTTQQERKDLGRLQELFDRYDPEYFQTTPSMYSLLIKAGWKGSRRLTLISGGELLPEGTLRELLPRCKSFYNMYGPTETTIYSTIYPVLSNEGPIYIGKPIGNTKVYVVDGQLRPLPVGVAGEICISGEGLATGYHHRDDMNAAKFLNDPLGTGERLYRTGDMGYWTTSGHLAFAGRNDNQVKVSGHRIECGEVEQALIKAGARLAAVSAVAGEEGNYLEACVEGIPETALTGFKERLFTLLPAYMVPTAWRLMERLPINSNGKIDRIKLQSDRGKSTTAEAIPLSATEKALAAIWEQVLSVKGIAATDDFLRLGGNSIAVLKVVSGIQLRFGLRLSMKDVFVHSTLQALAAKIEASGGLAADQILPAPQAAHYPLSHGQYRLWILDRLNPGNPVYNLPAALELDGTFDTNIFRSAVQLLLMRHEILRTIFVIHDGMPRQRVLDPDECDTGILIETAAAPHTAEELASEEALHAFDLLKGPLLRIRIMTVSPTKHWMFLNMHHIIADAWSLELMMRELSAYYQALQADAAFRPAMPDIQYKDYAVWQHHAVKTGQWQAHRTFWQEQLQGPLPVLELPLDKPRPKTGAHAGRQYRYVFPAPVAQRVKALADNEDASLFVVFFSLIKILLSKYSGQQDIIAGTAAAGRAMAALQEQAGFYVDTIPLRTSVDPAASFSAYLDTVKQLLWNALQHQAYPFDLIVEDLGLRPDNSRSPLFDVMINFQPADRQPQLMLPGVRITDIPVQYTTSKFDLTFDIVAGDTITLVTEYDTALWKEASIATMISRLAYILEQVTAMPAISIADITLCSQEERSLLLEGFNNTSVPYPQQETVASLFCRQAQSTPEHTALVYGGIAWSYRLLHAESNRIAAYLAAGGVRPGDAVGLISGRSSDAVLWMLAILKTGAMYVPVDSSYAAERVRYMLTDAGVSLLLTETALSFDPGVPAIVMGEAAYHAYAADELPPPAAAADTAYLMYTSGSTGHPKGVKISHRNIVRLVKGQDYVKLDGNTRLLLTGSLSFDASTFEIWGPLLNGGCLHVLPHEQLMDTATLTAAVREGSINMMWFTVAWLNQLADTCMELFAPLHTLLTGGDKMSVPHIGRIKAQYPSLRIINAYGPTENTTFTTTHEVSAADIAAGVIPIGRPLANTCVYILDANGHPQPAGITGEICISGDGLSAGYHGQEALTAAAFVPHPFSEGRLMYRSGDMACWREDGVVLFKGRKDHQVKIRGYRVECGEVEYALQKAGALEAVVLPFENETTQEKYLAAYVSGISEAAVAGFRERVQTGLPAYMQPSVLIRMDSFPVNANGKTDRSQLPLPATAPALNKYVAPETPMQQALAAIWASLLAIAMPGPDDNFFLLGGHSLKATRLTGLVAAQLQLELGLKDIYAFPVLRDMAAFLEVSLHHAQQITSAPPQPHYPLSANQYSLWVTGERQPELPAYNILGAYRLAGPLNATLLIKAFALLQARHESLRTVFRLTEEGTRQYIIPASEAVLPAVVYDWQQRGDHRDGIAALLSAEAGHRFDLAAGPLLKLQLVKIAEQVHILVLNMHHIIADGWSVEIMVKELRQYYHALCGDAAFTPPALQLQYKDYACWQEGWRNTAAFATAQQYWLQVFSEGVTAPDLSRLGSGGGLRTAAAGQLQWQPDEDMLQEINRLLAVLQVSHYVFFLTAWKILLSRMTGQARIVTGTPVANRTPHVMDQVGYYVNTLLIQLDIPAGASVQQLTQACSLQLTHALLHQEYPFHWLVAQLRALQLPVSDTVFNSGFSWLDQSDIDWNFGDVEISPIAVPPAFPKTPLWLSGTATQQGTSFNLVYDTAHISKETADILMRKWQKVLQAMLLNPGISPEEIDIRLEEELAMEHAALSMNIDFDF